MEHKSVVSDIGSILKDLKKSSMRACQHCLVERSLTTDYPITEMKRTKQNWLCMRHYKLWLERRRLRRSASTTQKATAR